MTGPAIPNQQLVDEAAAMETEGNEWTQIVQAVSDTFGQISSQLAQAQTDLAGAQAQAMDDTSRSAIDQSLANAKALADNGQAVLQALVTPPAPSGQKRGGQGGQNSKGKR